MVDWRVVGSGDFVVAVWWYWARQVLLTVQVWLRSWNEAATSTERD